MTAALTASIIGLLIAGTILYLVRRDHLHGSHAVWWLVVASAVLILGAFPQLVDWAAKGTGIAYAPVLPIIIGIGFILIRLLKLDIDRSRSERQIRRLTQKLAILEQELREVRPAVPPPGEAAADAPPRKSAQVIPLQKSGDA